MGDLDGPRFLGKTMVCIAVTMQTWAELSNNPEGMYRKKPVFGGMVDGSELRTLVDKLRDGGKDGKVARPAAKACAPTTECSMPQRPNPLMMFG